VGTPQTVFQFVRSGSDVGEPVSGQVVSIAVVSGANAGQSGSGPTDAIGQIIWRYETRAAGTDSVLAWLDLNGNGAADPGEPQNLSEFNILPAENVPPVADDTTASVREGDEGLIPLPGRDPDGTRVGYSIVSGPGNGTVSDVVTDAEVIYRPRPGFVGTDSFVYRVTDSGGLSAEGRVTVTVRAQILSPPRPGPCQALVATIVPKPGESVVFGTAGPDVIITDKPGIMVFGLDGNDVICSGGKGAVLFGGNGSDRIYVYASNSTVFGGNSDDHITATGDGHQLFGGNGQDRLTADDGDNRLYGGNGNDTLQVGAGRSLLAGGNGDDRLFAVSRRSTLWGGSGNDKIVFRPQNKVLRAV